MGPIMMDVHGTSLTSEDKELLAHPLVGGLILFARNYQSPSQVHALVKAIRAVNPEILVAVDHEGGRVQRFREQFSKIPAMGQIWTLCQQDENQAKQLAFHCGVIIALEVQSVAVDISFAPVLDVNDISQVIGDRAFHQSPELVSILAKAFIDGMHLAGMKVTGKHFPGHGSVEVDSHFDLPVDERSSTRIFSHDMKPFVELIQQNLVDAIMPAHVIYPQVDKYSVGFSSVWLQEILRKQLGFNGVIFSDDLSMKGASSIGGYLERAEAAQQAGCDMLLVCNDRDACIDVIDNANINVLPESAARVKKMQMAQKKRFNNYQDAASALQQNSAWQQAQQVLKQYNY